MQRDRSINVTTIDTTTIATDQPNESDADVAEKVRVFVRLRPADTNTDSDWESGHAPMLGAKPKANGTSIEVLSPRDGSFSTHFFDGVFDKVSHRELYQQTASNLIDAIHSGQNACLIAYGQTGTGKTYTMFGDNGLSECHGLEKEGIVQYLVQELMNDISLDSELAKISTIGDDNDDALLKQFPPVVMCSYIELYQDKFRDLLAVSGDGGIAAAGKFKVSSPSELKGRVGTGAVGGMFVTGAYWESCNEVDDVLKILNKGNRARSTSATNMNSASSRSHAIFTMKILYPGCEPRYLHLVDLAGSELASKTNALGETMEEAKSINKSLSALGNVVRAVTQGRTHVPYRDSKLTHFLQDAIGGSSTTSIILTVSPMASDASETMSTIRFGHRAKKVTNKKQVVHHDNDGYMQSLTALATSDEVMVEGHFGNETSQTRKHAVSSGFDSIEHEDASISSLEMAAETTIVPSEPSISNESTNQDLILSGSSVISSEASLHASMVDSSCINSDIASVSSKYNDDTTLVQPEPTKSELVPSSRFPFNSPSVSISNKSNKQMSHNAPQSGNHDDVHSTPYSSSVDDIHAHSTGNLKTSHSSDSYFNVGRNLFDSGNDEGSQSHHSVTEDQSKVAKGSRRKSLSRAAGLVGVIVFCLSAIQKFRNKDIQSEVWSEIDYCPVNASFLVIHGYQGEENTTNLNGPIMNSSAFDEGIANHTYNTSAIEDAQSYTREFAGTTLAIFFIIICLSPLLDGYRRQRNPFDQESSHNASDSDVLKSLSKPILKDILRKKNMKVSGTKQVLIDRLRDSVNSDASKTPTPKRKSKKDSGDDISKLTVSVLKTRLKEKGLKLTGTKADLLLRLKLADDDSDLTKSELKAMLSKKGLKVSGTKADLADRLAQANF